MTEIDDIIPSGSYLSAKVNRPGEQFVIAGFTSEKSRYKEGQVNIVLILTDSEGDEKKVTINKQSRENIANAFSRTLEKWIGKTIEIAYLRPTAYGNTIDFLPSRNQPAVTTPPAATAKKPADLLEAHLRMIDGGKGVTLTTLMATATEGGYNPDLVDTIVDRLKAEGRIVEVKKNTYRVA